MKFIYIVAAIIIVLALYGAYETMRVKGLIARSATLVENTKPYTSPDAPGKLSMLVLGDSTAYGVGAASSSESLPGRVAALLGGASVENYAVSGAVVAQIAQQLTEAQKNHYDLILIQGGANNVVQFKSLNETALEMDALLKAAHTKSDNIVFLTAGKIGEAPLFPLGTRWIFNLRAAVLRAKFMQLATKDDAAYVDLFGEANSFNSNPNLYYAADDFHPSAAGYGVWYASVEEVIKSRYPELVHGQ